MRAVQFSETGAPEVLRVVELGAPHPKAGRIRIAVKAAGVNAIDWKLRSGLFPTKLPSVPGSEAAGVVDEIGDGVDDVAIGDEVFGSAVKAGYAEFVVLNAWQAKPSSMSWVEAAAATQAPETAARAFDTVGLVDGETLVINGASGGVGTAAVQLAVGRGVRVIGVAGTANHDYLRMLGAEAVVYGDGLIERIREIAAGGVDVAFDVAGNGVIPELIALTGNADRVVSIADFTATEHGAKVTSGGAGRAWHVLATVAELFEQGRFRVEIQQVFPLAEAAEAHRIIQAGHTRGKLVLEL